MGHPHLVILGDLWVNAGARLKEFLVMPISPATTSEVRSSDQEELGMKARLFRIAVAVSGLVALVEVLGAGRKWQ